MKGKYTKISLDRILDPKQPLRNDLSHESVKDLYVSIKQIGIINPLIVKKSGDNFELIAGHRRLVAAHIAGLTEVPCMVVEAKGITGEVIKLQENLIRDDINPIEWAKHLDYLKKQYKVENVKIADMLGMSEAWVSQHLQILEYPKLLLEGLEADRLSFSAARELAQIKDKKKRDVYVKHAISGGVTPTLAVRWRKEANREPTMTALKAEVQGTTPTPNLNPPQQTKCKVCGEVIEEEDSMYLNIHRQCQPQKEKEQ